jgi:hypothetical protein
MVVFGGVFRFTTWLLVLGVMLGMGGRLLMAQGGQITPCVEVEHCCDADGDHHSSAPDEHDDDHGPDCPPGPHHHHQGQCFVSGAMMAEAGTRCTLAVVEGGRTTLCFGAEKLPDGPVFSLDKPPLI